MGKKVKIHSPWLWPPYCQQPKTLSFRFNETNINNKNNMLKAIANFAYNIADVVEVDKSTNSSTCFTNSSKSTSFTTYNEEEGDSDVETVIKGLTSSDKRLLFEPGKSKTSSILDQEQEQDTRSQENEELSVSLQEEEQEQEQENESIVLLSMESQNPYMEFKKSMEEMVEANQELKSNWEGLEELLCCYLGVNVKSNHGYIVSAFVDLLLGLVFDSSNSPCSTSISVASTTTSTNDSCSSCCHGDIVYHSPLSCCTSFCSSSSSCCDSSISTPCVSSLELVEEGEEGEEEELVHVTSCIEKIILC